jgi:hypothetical protein
MALYPLNRRLGGLQNPTGRCKEETNVYLCWESNPEFRKEFSIKKAVASSNGRSGTNISRMVSVL